MYYSLIIWKKYACFLNAFLYILYNKAKNNFLIRLAHKWRECFFYYNAVKDGILNQLNN